MEINGIPVLPPWPSRPDQRAPNVLMRNVIRVYRWLRFNTLLPQMLIGRWLRYGWGNGPEIRYDRDELIQECALAAACVAIIIIVVAGAVSALAR